MQTKHATLPPSYTTIIQHIGEQLNKRGYSIFKRTLLIGWPFILLAIVTYPVTEMGLDSFSAEHHQMLLIATIVYCIPAFLYVMVMSFIFKIEKQIWVDSFFDNRNLELHQSWAIAKKIFWPALKLRLFLFFRYYLPPLLIFILIIPTWFAFLQNEPPANQSKFMILMLYLIAVLPFIVIAIYFYLIRIKLRYTWFIFLDTYGSNYSIKTLINDMHRLNNVSKTESFKKSLMANLGTDLLNTALGNMIAGMTKWGTAGGMLGGATNVYAESATRHTTEYSNITVQYMLYRFARQEMYGEEQKINEELYNLQGKVH